MVKWFQMLIIALACFVCINAYASSSNSYSVPWYVNHLTYSQEGTFDVRYDSLAMTPSIQPMKTTKRWYIRGDEKNGGFIFTWVVHYWGS